MISFQILSHDIIFEEIFVGKTQGALAIDWMVEHEGETCENNSSSKLLLAKHTWEATI